MIACRHGRIDIARMLIVDFRASIDIQTKVICSYSGITLRRYVCFLYLFHIVIVSKLVVKFTYRIECLLLGWRDSCYACLRK